MDVTFKEWTTAMQTVFDIQEEDRIVQILDFRKGQTWFNFLYLRFPHLSEKIRGTNVDPFYDDKKIPAFLKYLEEIWNDYD